MQESFRGVEMSINQIKVGIILSYMSEIIKILTGIIFTPIMLRLLGKSEYGLYQLVYSVVSYLSILSLGFSSSYIRFYTRYKVKQQENDIARLNGMFMIIFSLISFISIVCGAVMLFNIKGIFGEGLSTNEYSIAKVLMGLMILNLALTFPTSVLECYVTANEQFIFQKVVNMLHSLLNPFLALPLLIMGIGSIGMVTITTILTLLKLIVNMWYCKKKLKMQFIFRKFNLSLFKEMWVFTFYIFINQIIDQVNWNVDKFLLGRLSGTGAVALYGLAGQLNTMYMQLSSAISNVFVPKINSIVAEDNGNKPLSDLFIKIGRIQFIFLGLIITGFVFFGKEFIQFWAGKGYQDSYWCAIFLLIPITIPLIQNLGIEIQRAMNMHKARVIVLSIIAVINIFISIPLIKLYGAVGATIGTAVSIILGNILFMNYYYHKKVGIDIIRFWKEILSIILSMIPAIVGGAIMKILMPTNNIVLLAVYIISYSCIYILSVWRFGMNPYEKRLIYKPIRQIISRF